MPQPPRRGACRGPAGAAKAKASPIARPSADYARKLDDREYGGQSKEERERQRALEAEDRRLKREAGERVDLGSSGDAWARLADPAGARTQTTRRVGAAPRAIGGDPWAGGADPWAWGADPWATSRSSAAARPGAPAPAEVATAPPPRPKSPRAQAGGGVPRAGGADPWATSWPSAASRPGAPAAAEVAAASPPRPKSPRSGARIAFPRAVVQATEASAASCFPTKRTEPAAAGPQQASRLREYLDSMAAGGKAEKAKAVLRRSAELGQMSGPDVARAIADFDAANAQERAKGIPELGPPSGSDVAGAVAGAATVEIGEGPGSARAAALERLGQFLRLSAQRGDAERAKAVLRASCAEGRATAAIAGTGVQLADVERLIAAFEREAAPCADPSTDDISDEEFE